jgi:hypothetical protein
VGRFPQFRFAPIALLAVALALPLVVSTTRAQEGLYLTWNDCPLGIPAADLAFGCDSDTDTLRLVCSFVPGRSTGSDVIGVEVVVDIQLVSDTLTAWWQLSPAGGCRSGMLAASAAPVPDDVCADLWGGGAIAEIQGYLPGEPRGQPNQVRIKAVAGVPANAPRALAEGLTYRAVNLLLRTERTTGPFRCVGCFDPACLVLNSIWVRRVPGAPGGDLFIQASGQGNANRATWQGAAAGACATVPARRPTWGLLKALYR